MKKIELIKIDNFIDSLLGLLKFEKHPILLQTRFGIHTFFLKSDIYCYLLEKDNEKMRIIKQKKVKPFRIFLWDPRYSLLIESFTDLQIDEGEEIKIIFLPS